MRMDRRRSRLILTSDAADSDIPQAWWLARTLEQGYPETVHSSWSTRVRTLDLPAKTATVHRRRRTEDFESAAVEIAGTLVYLDLRGGTLRAEVAAHSQAEAKAVLTALRDLFPGQTVDEDGRRVPIQFWRNGLVEGEDEGRMVEVPSWEEIASNYAARTRRDLELLTTAFRPGEGGRLILWHGPPGTGKTFALRALAWEWRSWCRIHYITDPETLLANPGYLLDVALDTAEPWRLIALEDTGELLAPDARERTGQGLSRLLNLADGLLGQGTKTLILITTNEPLARIHPAVARPGRCAAEMEFRPLSDEEARAWLARRGGDASLVRGATTIAELHAMDLGREVDRAPVVGFRAERQGTAG